MTRRIEVTHVASLLILKEKKESKLTYIARYRWIRYQNEGRASKVVVFENEKGKNVTERKIVVTAGSRRCERGNACIIAPRPAVVGARYLLINYLIGFHGKFGLRSSDTKIIALHLTPLLL
jgi:hypothetical protein